MKDTNAIGYRIGSPGPKIIVTKVIFITKAYLELMSYTGPE